MTMAKARGRVGNSRTSMPNEERDLLGSRKVSLPWSWLLALYLVLVVGSAAWMLIEVFPSPPHDEQKTAHKDEPKNKGTGGAGPSSNEPTAGGARSSASAGTSGQGPAAGGAGAAENGTGGTAAGIAGTALASTAGGSVARAQNGGATVSEKPAASDEDQDRPSWPTNLKYGTFAHLGIRIAPQSNDQGILILALLAGILGSFMHAAQSLAIYVGNRDLRRSWVLLYALRPWIGGVLGLLFYFVLRAGLIPAAAASSTDAVSPYGVVAFGALAGWFSKRVTDKLAEMVDMLFRTQQDAYKDNTARDGRPDIVSVVPDRIAVSMAAPNQEFMVTCGRILPGAWFVLENKEYKATFKGNMKISFTLPGADAQSFAGKATVMLIVYNPPDPGADADSKPRPSAPFDITVVP